MTGAVDVDLDRVAVDGDVYDALEDCDQLTRGLGRLYRLGRISDQDWRTSTARVAEIRTRIEQLTTTYSVA